jgi:uncharacterized protein YuzE
MKILYDELADGIVIEFSDRKPSQSHPLGQDVMIYTDHEGRLVQLSIRPASAHVDNPFEITTEFASKAVAHALLKHTQMNQK